MVLNTAKVEESAEDVFELPNNLRAIRVNGSIYVADNDTNKIKYKVKDVFSSNPSRAAFQLIKLLKISNKTKDIWTCSFRPNQNRWIWYVNSEPKATVAFSDFNKKIANKSDFYSSHFGTLIIDDIKKFGLKLVATNLNASILEKPYMKIICSSCSSDDNYTIDDIVDESKNPDYDSRYVVCSSCSELINLTN